MPRVLIFGTSYVDRQERKWLLDQWVRINRKLNPECDLLIVDTPGGFDFEVDVETYRFEDNIGHLTRTNKDGWGRAFTHGVEHGIAAGHDYIVHIETDLLFARPVMPIISLMDGFKLPWLSTQANPHSYMETGLFFMDAERTDDYGVIEQYNWENPPEDRMFFPERRMRALLGEYLFYLPLQGMRDDVAHGRVDLRKSFPYGMDWLTHSTVACYRTFMDMNGLLE